LAGFGNVAKNLPMSEFLVSAASSGEGNALREPFGGISDDASNNIQQAARTPAIACNVSI
jgi:hypothetical protein